VGRARGSGGGGGEGKAGDGGEGVGVLWCFLDKVMKGIKRNNVENHIKNDNREFKLYSFKGNMP